MDMNKALSLSVVALTVMAAACSGGKTGEAIDSDSICDSIMETIVEPEGQHVCYMTKDSVGAIRVGMSVNEIPDSIAGLYDRKVNGSSPDAVTISFLNKEGEQFIAYDFGEGKVDVLNAVGTSVMVKAPRGEFGLGDKFSKVLELPGVTEEWAGYDGGGMWYWKWEGLWFAPSQENLPSQLARRLYHSGDAPTVADFTEEVTVGFIGTGLPF